MHAAARQVCSLARVSRNGVTERARAYGPRLATRHQEGPGPGARGAPTGLEHSVLVLANLRRSYAVVNAV